MKLRIIILLLIFSTYVVSANVEKDSNFFNADRGTFYATGIGFGTGFFIDSQIKNLILRPSYIFSFKSLDFMFSTLISLVEDFDTGTDLKYLNSYLGIGVNWHIVDLAKLIDYFSSTIGVGARFYLSTNLIEDFKFYQKIPYLIDPYIFIELSTKKSIPFTNIYFRFEFLFIDTFSISFDFGIKYIFRNEKKKDVI